MVDSNLTFQLSKTHTSKIIMTV